MNTLYEIADFSKAEASRHPTSDFVPHSSLVTCHSSLLIDFAETIRRDNRDLRPRDMIDLQSFIWVQGSDEYSD